MIVGINLVKLQIITGGQTNELLNIIEYWFLKFNSPRLNLCSEWGN